ncbi:hypothetical protein CH294_22900 [Rhodococcus sp. 14-2483-1-1]|uniref:hypothetical protein n=1 Tax=Rhodococcus sp. 14-2483-1-1 TaxID=2023148 RepID=UPI000B9A7152|nr:hypothetical protein [Rhodococcus sp. 14-2483-1-1]OZF31081.1 hypothetical protein CH294_22900 [Rhodococcus sp. 14-2483-1-1]
MTGQLSDALGVIGLSDDMGSIGALVTGIANYKPVEGSEAATGLKQLYGNTFADQLGMAAELNPDMKFDPQEWMRKLADQLLVPAVLRDSGGPLPHGMAALNMSGDTEHVYTGKQNSMFKELASIRASVGGQNSSGQLDLSELNRQVSALAENASRPNVTYHTDSIAAAMREDRVRQTRQSLSYSRR